MQQGKDEPRFVHISGLCLPTTQALISVGAEHSLDCGTWQLLSHQRMVRGPPQPLPSVVEFPALQSFDVER